MIQQVLVLGPLREVQQMSRDLLGVVSMFFASPFTTTRFYMGQI